MPQYIALIHYDDPRSCRISFPDFPGCTAETEGLEQVIASAATALRYHIKDMEQRGEPVPPPRPIVDIRADPVLEERLRKAIVTFIAFPPPRRPLQRITIELDVDLLDAIDRVSEDYGLTRSGFLTRAAAVMLAENGGVTRMLRPYPPPEEEEGDGDEAEPEVAQDNYAAEERVR